MNDHRGNWALCEAENRAELLAYLGTSPAATSHRSADLTWVVTNVPDRDHNGVAWARLTPADADAQVAPLVEQFRMQDVPAVWHIDPASAPADLGERLTRLGCRPVGGGLCLAARLSGLAREISRFPGLTVERVLADAELTEWLAVRQAVAPEAGPFRHDVYRALAQGGRAALHFYLARVDGQPAGCAQLFLGQRAAGLYSVGVPTPFRGRGIGTALVLTPLLVARTLGYDLGVVQPPDDSVQMYEHLGFERLTMPVFGYEIGQ